MSVSNQTTANYRVALIEIEPFDYFDYPISIPCPSCKGQTDFKPNYRIFRENDYLLFIELGFDVGGWYCPNCKCFILRAEDMEKILTLQLPSEKEKRS